MIATPVPAMKPIMPTRRIKQFLISMGALSRQVSGQKVTMSSMGGNSRARALLENAPIREITRSRWGMKAAKPTGSQQYNITTGSITGNVFNR